jgi:hypothetical protein
MGTTEPGGVGRGATASGRTPASACSSESPSEPAAGAERRTRVRSWRPVSRDDLRETMLQWSTGLLATLLGAQMLIVPHQLSAQAYDVIRPHIGV